MGIQHRSEVYGNAFLHLPIRLSESKKFLRNLINEIRFLLVNYVFGPIVGVLFCLLEAIGRIRFVHFERFPIWEEKLIIVSNHPSLFEPVLLPFMGFPWMNFPWVFSSQWGRLKFSLRWFSRMRKEFNLPKKLIPANVPDRQNFFDYGFWRLFQGINVPVDRNGRPQDRISSISALKSILEDGGRVLIFPEGGRTFKTVQKGRLKSAGGREIGNLKHGAAWLAINTGARVLPIWIEGTDKVLPNNRFPLPRLWHRITIKIGEPFLVSESGREEATSEITRALLALADEE
ncbi:MAG: lysophospholipid acyltransferase family protein [Dehalococcoidales bacterium]|jgi:1-acyl-sn-glycerol-3-phosphate acyltransferase